MYSVINGGGVRKNNEDVWKSLINLMRRGYVSRLDNGIYVLGEYERSDDWVQYVKDIGVKLKSKGELCAIHVPTNKIYILNSK